MAQPDNRSYLNFTTTEDEELKECKHFGDTTLGQCLGLATIVLAFAGGIALIGLTL